MAEKEYTVVAPDGKEITLVGPVGASQAEIIAQAQRLYKPEQTAPVAQDTSRSPLDYLKAAGEGTLAALSTIPASAYGAYKTVTSPMYGTQAGIKYGEEQAKKALYEPSQASQEILAPIGQAIEEAKIPAYVPGAGKLAEALKQTTKFTPAVSVIKKTPTAVVGEAVTETPKSTVVQRYKEALTPVEKPTYATSAELEKASTDLFKKAKEYGVEVNAKDFSENMKAVGKQLVDEAGYDPELYPKIDTVIRRLSDPTVAKDFNKLKSLRTMIGNLQSSQDLSEKRIATKLKGEFDNYIATLPEESIVSGSKEGLDAWKEARNVYSRLSKSQIFEDMLDTAKLEKGKYSQAGIEQSLYNQLKNLAKSDKKMRMFTAEEQDAIRKAAEGSDLQNTLKFIGKFAPTSTVSSILPLLVTGASAPAGILGTAAAIGSRAAAAQMRKSQVEQLANLMRGTVNPEWQAQQKPVNPQLLKMLRMDQGE